MCYGNCPSYQVTLRADGGVEWWGFGFVARTGFARRDVSDGEVETLVDEFWQLVALRRAAELVELVEGYDRKASEWRPEPRRDWTGVVSTVCTDVPTTTMSLQWKGQHTTITAKCWGDDESVFELARAIDDAARTREWITTDPCEPQLESMFDDDCFLRSSENAWCWEEMPGFFEALRGRSDLVIRLWAIGTEPVVHERLRRARDYFAAAGVANDRTLRYVFPPEAEDPDGWANSAVRIELGTESCMRIEPRTDLSRGETPR